MAFINFKPINILIEEESAVDTSAASKRVTRSSRSKSRPHFQHSSSSPTAARYKKPTITAKSVMRRHRQPSDESSPPALEAFLPSPSSDVQISSYMATPSAWNNIHSSPILSDSGVSSSQWETPDPKNNLNITRQPPQNITSPLKKSRKSYQELPRSMESNSQHLGKATKSGATCRQITVVKRSPPPLKHYKQIISGSHKVRSGSHDPGRTADLMPAEERATTISKVLKTKILLPDRNTVAGVPVSICFKPREGSDGCQENFRPDEKKSNRMEEISKSLKKLHSLRITSDWRPVDNGKILMIKTALDEHQPKPRLCYNSIQHSSMNETVQVGDCVKIHDIGNLESIGRVVALHYSEEEAALMCTVFWFYTRTQLDPKCNVPWIMHEKELLASKHLDTVNVDSIESLAYVLTFNEYARYHAETEADQLPMERQQLKEKAEKWPRGDERYRRRHLLPHDDTPQDMVYFCRGIYSIKSKKIHTVINNNRNQ